MAQPVRKTKPQDAAPQDAAKWWLDIPIPQPETRAPTRQVSARMPSEDLKLLESLVEQSEQNLTIYLRWLVRVAAAGGIVPPKPTKGIPGT